MNEPSSQEKWAIERFSRYIRFLAGVYSTRGHWRMESDDVAAELWLTVLETLRAYPNKSRQELEALIKKSLNNRLSTLRRRDFMQGKARLDTHLVELTELMEEGFESVGGIFDVFSDWLDYISHDPTPSVELAESIRKVVAMLSEVELEVLKAYMGYNPAVWPQYQLACMRKRWIYQDPKLPLTDLIVARALHYTPFMVARSRRSITKKLEDAWN